MRDWIRRSFKNRIFVTVLLVTLVPMLLCDVFIMQISIRRSGDMLYAQAQSELDSDNTSENVTFYCVGHTVTKYALDDYPIKSLLGHKGKKVEVELIAAFLPSLVVESLYTVMDMNGLDVCSLTLEPIAAMNVIIPPEVRLINIALVDIGAGTTDIAISRSGSIVAYAMATIAGDEITEDIIQKYLVEF